MAGPREPAGRRQGEQVITQEVVFLSALILVLFIVWLALKLQVRVRRTRAREIRKLNLASYVTFINNYKRGEEAEGRGSPAEALRCYRRALESLREDVVSDDLTRETTSELEDKIAALEQRRRSSGSGGD